jgi:hypothetical protein
MAADLQCRELRQLICGIGAIGGYRFQSVVGRLLYAIDHDDISVNSIARPPKLLGLIDAYLSRMQKTSV